jgi:hypothetical protein
VNQDQSRQNKGKTVSWITGIWRRSIETPLPGESDRIKPDQTEKINPATGESRHNLDATQAASGAAPFVTFCHMAILELH